MSGFGHDSFHELSPPGASFFAEVQHYLCAPLLLFGALGWRAHPPGAARQVALPTRTEVGALAAVLALYVLWPSPLPAPLDDRGIVQLAVCGLMLLIAARRLPDFSFARSSAGGRSAVKADKSNARAVHQRLNTEPRSTAAPWIDLT